MKKRMIDADSLEKILNWVSDECNIEFIERTAMVRVDFLIEKINELATLATDINVGSKIRVSVFDYFYDLKNRIENEVEKPLEDSMLGITADNAYIAGLKTALRFSNDTAGFVLDRHSIEPQTSTFDTDGY